MLHHAVLIVAVVAGTLAAIDAVQAEFPPEKQWCTIQGCKGPPPDVINRLLQQENKLLGQGPAKCGDGRCNVVAGESCATCEPDCGECRLRDAHRKCKKKNQWALTFDDGPSNFTEGLVKTLNDAKVKATFFVIGNNVMTAGKKAANAMKLAFDSGHEIGSHTYTHRSLGDKLLEKNGAGDEKKIDGVKGGKAARTSFLRAEMLFTDEVIEKVIGKRVRFLRPPFLDRSPDNIGALETMGYVPVNINVDSLDFTLAGKDNANPPTVLKQMKEAFANNSALGSWISLQHDIHEFSVNAVKDIIDFVRSQNAELVPLSECIGEQPYRADGANAFLRPESVKNLS